MASLSGESGELVVDCCFIAVRSNPSPACSRETRRAFGFSGSGVASTTGGTSIGSVFSTFRAMIFGFDTGSSTGVDIGSVGFLRTTFGLILRVFLSQAVFSVVCEILA